jgi:hypothetical protein
LLYGVVKGLHDNLEFLSVERYLIQIGKVIAPGAAFVLLIGEGMDLFHSFMGDLIEVFIGVSLSFPVKIS